MNKSKRSELKKMLLAQRAELTGDLEKTIKSSNDDEYTGLVSDVADDAARSSSRQLLLNLGEQERKRLKLIEDALERMEDGTYGTCSECEQSIPDARLNIVPFAQYCVQCLEQQENQEKAQTLLNSFEEDDIPKA